MSQKKQDSRRDVNCPSPLAPRDGRAALRAGNRQIRISNLSVVFPNSSVNKNAKGVKRVLLAALPAFFFLMLAAAQRVQFT